MAMMGKEEKQSDRLLSFLRYSRNKPVFYIVNLSIILIISIYLMWSNALPISDTIWVIIISVFGTSLISLTVQYIQRRRLYLSEATKEYEEALRKLDEEDFAEYERIKQMREDKLEIEFKDNIGRTFVLQNLRFKDVGFFSECEWAFRPGVNVLLGRNGYGKSLILRTLAALLQRDDERSQDLLKNSNSAIELTISRDGKDKLIRRTSERFTDSVGKIPLLAIPDSRYLDRSQMKIGPSGESYDNLRDHGAYHFLHQLPYGGVIQSLLHEICLDYWEHGRNLKLPVIRFLEDAIGRLAGDRFEFSSIGRIGREQFGIEILTEGTENPMPIHYASQGTLSVFMLFGLTRSFLKSVYGESDTVNEQPAIVIIDEMDAHLHPKWQQRVIHLLRELFPHVQFIICAQNPAMVAGCLEHEVAVLRMSNKKFRIQQLDRDFVGATPRELYSDLFDIEEPDDSLLQHPEWKPLESDTMERLRQLDKKADEGSLNGKESAERHYMIRETRVRRKVSDASDNREDEEQKVLQLEAEIDRLRARISKLDPGKADKDGEVLE